MEQLRLFIAIALSFLVFLVWNFFFVEQQPVNTQTQNQDQAVNSDNQKPAQDTSVKPVEPELMAQTPQPEQVVQEENDPPKTIVVKSPLYTVEISEKGAVFTKFTLNKYKEHVDDDSPLKQLIPETLKNIGTIQSEFTGGGIPNLKNVKFSADFSSDNIDVMNNPVALTFSWKSPQGLIFEKRFSFSPDTYLIGLNINIKNAGSGPVQGNLKISLIDNAPAKETSYGFEGPSALIDDSLEQIKIKKLEDKNTYKGELKWLAIESRYFMSGIIPKEPADSRIFLSLTKDKIIENQYIGPETIISSGTQKQFEFDLFFGPKKLELLKSFNNGLNRLINFGWFDFIAKPCLWLMNVLYKAVPNYGLAIIILTILIKILLWPLGNKSYKSMNEMKKIQPLMAEIREKYKDDKKKMNEELMGLYKIYKINPMGGCLPMVLQIPVFFAFYRMLYEAIELRHAPFFGWINDLSAPDRLFDFGFSIPFMEPPYGIPVLTIIMGGTMFLQQKMSPPPGDPAQAKMMMFMPVIFTFIFINFSSGLVLYWLINNILSISQQYYILKKNA